MRIAALVLFGLLPTALLAQSLGPLAAQQPDLPSAFQNIGDPVQRSRTIFTEIGKVLTHPRCMNCHPAG